jgi:hypothetical protein
MAFLQQHVPMLEERILNGNAATPTVVGENMLVQHRQLGENTLEPACSVTP